MGNIPRRKQISAVDGPSLFGPPKLLDGEDVAAYDSLSTRVLAEVSPLDVIEEMHVNDVVYLTWEIQRWRRLMSQVLRARQREMLERFLNEIDRKDPGERMCCSDRR